MEMSLQRQPGWSQLASYEEVKSVCALGEDEYLGGGSAWSKYSHTFRQRTSQGVFF